MGLVDSVKANLKPKFMKMVFCTPCDSHGLRVETFKNAGMKEVVEAACVYLGIKPVVMFGKGRNRPHVEKRYMVMSYLSHSMNIRLTEIGRFFDKDHTTVIHGKKLVANLCATDPRFNDQYIALTKYLNTIQ
jgi:chromosomal replication initiator protein